MLLFNTNYYVLSINTIHIKIRKYDFTTSRYKPFWKPKSLIFPDSHIDFRIDTTLYEKANYFVLDFNMEKTQENKIQYIYAQEHISGEEYRTSLLTLLSLPSLTIFVPRANNKNVAGFDKLKPLLKTASLSTKTRVEPFKAPGNYLQGLLYAAFLISSALSFLLCKLFRLFCFYIINIWQRKYVYM